VITDIDLGGLLAFHRSRGALATIAVREVANPTRFGVVVTDENGRVRSFQEKPAPGTEKSRLANMGIYILEPEIFADIPADQEFDFGHQLFPLLLGKNAPVYALKTEAYWSDVGTLSQYLYTNWDLLTRPGLVGERVGKHTVIEPGAVVSSSVLIGDHCHIRSGAVVMGCSCIGNGTVVEATSRVLDSILWTAEHLKLTVADEVVRAIVTHEHRVDVGFQGLVG
jgi:mannose-1-phosphate guanylyltransferase/mannose-1-phosphate guanylyltransferase/phosphomannomutase